MQYASIFIQRGGGGRSVQVSYISLSLERLLTDPQKVYHRSDRQYDHSLDEPDTSITQVKEGYEVLAEKGEDDLSCEASPWGNSYFQQYYAWPAAKSALPELTDHRVFLAGCGRGDHVHWFLETGATVTGVDVSETAIQAAQDRFGNAASFYQADLTKPLAFAEDESFDLVFSNLVFSHIRAWRPVFEELYRILRSRGHLIITTIHPHYIRSNGDVESYYTITEVMNEWPGVEIPTFYRPMTAVVTPFIEAGFQLEVFTEPKPQDAYEEYQPQRYQDALTEPELLVIRARADC